MLQPTTNNEPSILIIGAGTFGTSTTLHLSNQYRDPSRITIIDRQAPDAPREENTAAAIDSSRIIHAHYENDAYRQMVLQVMHTWTWTMGYLGHFQETGLVVCSRRDGTGEDKNARVWGRGGGLEKLKGLEALGLDGGGGGCLFEAKAGWVDATSATASFMRGAESRGVQRVTGEVEELVFDAEKRRVVGVRTTSGEVLTADKIILATGAWTSMILSPVEHALQIPEENSVERQITAVGRLSVYYSLSEDETQRLVSTKTPIVVIPGEVEIIPPSLQNRTLKINDLRTEIINTIQTSSGRKISAPSTKDQHDVPQDIKTKSMQRIRAALPDFMTSREPDRWRMCYDAVTPTGDWVMTRHPDERLDNLYIVVGGSFHSYKFLPIAGKYMLNVLKGESNGVEMDESWGWKTPRWGEKERREVREFEGGEKAEVKSRL